MHYSFNLLFTKSKFKQMCFHIILGYVNVLKTSMNFNRFFFLMAWRNSMCHLFTYFKLRDVLSKRSLTARLQQRIRNYVIGVKFQFLLLGHQHTCLRTCVNILIYQALLSAYLVNLFQLFCCFVFSCFLKFYNVYNVF